MFERFMRLFRRRDIALADVDPVTPEPPSLVQPAPRLSAPVPSPGGTELIPKGPPPPSGSITVSLRSIVLKLPDTLKAKVRQPPTGGVRIPVPLQQVIPQLPQGSVKISFGDIRKAAPAGVFSDSADRDHTLVELPLQEILTQVPPDKLPRRASQKRIEIPEEVTPIFGPQAKHQNNVRVAHPSKSDASALKPGPSQAKPAAHPTVSPAPKQTAPPPPSPTLGTPGATHQPLPITPTQPLPTPSALKSPTPQPATRPVYSPIKPSTPLPSLTTSPPPAAPPPKPATPTQPAFKPAGGPVPQPTAKPIAQPSVKPPAQAAPSTAPASPTAGKDDFISAPLVALTTGWPAPIRQALAGLNAPDAVLLLPASETELGLKRGKVVFPWKRLKPLIRPPLKTALAPALDEIQLELPLSAIAPLFLAQRKPTGPQKKYDIGDDIPDVFTNRGLATIPDSPQDSVPASVSTPPIPAGATPIPAPQEPVAAPAVQPTPAPSTGQPATSSASTAPSPIPTPAPTPSTAPPAATAPVPKDIGELFGQPGRKNWAPAELVQRTAGLPGVAGALVTMQDGLLVAAHLPSGLNGESIAAFLPQMYTRVIQYSKEFKFNQTDHITLVIDDVPLRIFKAGGIFFAALGCAREPLPDPHLKLVASHLAPQSK
jgi:predicted regulator of Ras-like GTPase activity (Roadblock/LC7/MglB family)